MLAATRPMGGPSESRSRGSFLESRAGRLLSFTLTRPGAVALTLIFGGLGSAVAVNALWLQSERHPAPFFHQATTQPRHLAASPARKPLDIDPAAADAAAVLPPVRRGDISNASDAGIATAVAAAKPPAAKHPAKDPIADLISGSATTPRRPALSTEPTSSGIAKPATAASLEHLQALHLVALQPAIAPIRPPKPAAKAHPINKAATPPANDALAALIERSAKAR